jgi:hypothetical protein
LEIFKLNASIYAAKMQTWKLFFVQLIFFVSNWHVKKYFLTLYLETMV